MGFRIQKYILRLLILTVALLAGCAHKGVLESQRERGWASWYGLKFQGKKTATGEKFDMNELTAAHKKLPFGTIVQVRRISNNQTVQVRINDRGPFAENRILDLSYAAAKKIGMVNEGTAEVEIEVIKLPVTANFKSGLGRVSPVSEVAQFQFSR